MDPQHEEDCDAPVLLYLLVTLKTKTCKDTNPSKVPGRRSGRVVLWRRKKQKTQPHTHKTKTKHFKDINDINKNFTQPDLNHPMKGTWQMPSQ